MANLPVPEEGLLGQAASKIKKRGDVIDEAVDEATAGTPAVKPPVKTAAKKDEAVGMPKPSSLLDKAKKLVGLD